LFQRLVRLGAVFDTGFGVDVGEIASCGAATDVIVEVSRADDFPVVFGEGWAAGY